MFSILLKYMYFLKVGFNWSVSRLRWRLCFLRLTACESVRSSVDGRSGQCFLSGARMMTISNDFLDELLKGCRRSEVLVLRARMARNRDLPSVPPMPIFT